MTDNKSLSEKQRKEMYHALGLDDNGKGDMYRNYFCTYGEDESWEDLVTKGYATRRPFPKGFRPENGIYYFVTEAGKEAIFGKELCE